MDTFYYFHWAQSKNEILIEPTIAYSDEDLFFGRLPLKEPFETKIAEGKRLYDIVHFEDPFNFSISEKVHQILNAHRITGWKSYEIVVRDMGKKLFGFQVTGKCGPLVR